MIKIKKVGEDVLTNVSLTSSKSITNRALIIQALCNEKIIIENAALAEDSKILNSVLENLLHEINVKDAGTAFRFLTAYLSIQPGTFILTGTERMKERPIGGLVKALIKIGAQIEFIENENFPPLKIIGSNLMGGQLSIDASESSQYISALLLIAPKLSQGLKLELTGKINSVSYIDMTLSLMTQFGIDVKRKDNSIEIPDKNYSSGLLRVENDWSSASFWYEIAALSNKSEIVLKGLNLNSIQGDVAIAEIMSQFGVYSEQFADDIIIRKNINSTKPDFFEFDFSSCPDLVLPVATVCVGLNVPSCFKGVKNLRIKESDRLQAIKNELEKIGGNLIIEDDSLLINSSVLTRNDEIFHSYNDHRMIMSLAPLALKFDEIIIDDHLPVKKSYPGFWDDLKNAGFSYDVI